MDLDRFAGIVHLLAESPSRRRVGQVLAGLTAGATLAPLLEPITGEAKKGKKKPKKKKCKGGKKKCGKQCVDLQTDANNCGGCGRQCANGQACEQGTCSGGACFATVLPGEDLQAAIDAGASTGLPYTICLTAGTYTLSPYDPDEPPCDLFLYGGHLLGAGPGQTILQGSGQRGAMCAASDSQMTGLTVTGGVTDGVGGGINMADELTMTNCTVTGNTAGEGGGIFISYFSHLVLDGCTISGNVAHRDVPPHGRGGGIYNLGTLTRTNTTISGNTSDEGPDCFNDEEGTGC